MGQPTMRAWNDLDEGSRLVLRLWILLGCPLLGAGAALDSRSSPLWLNGLASLLAFLFGVPLVLVIATGLIARLRAMTTASLLAASLGVTCVWGVILAATIGSAAS